MRYESMSVAEQTVELSIVGAEFRLDPERLRAGVRDAGKTLRAVTIHSRGRLVREGGEWLLELAASGQKLPVAMNAADPPANLSGAFRFSGRIEIPEPPRPAAGPLRILEVQSDP